MNQLFQIFDLNAQQSEAFALQQGDPHQHDFEELIIGVKGAINHFIDYNATIVTAPFISFVSKGKVHRVVPDHRDPDFKVWIIRFKSEFIPETIFQFYAHYHNQATHVFQDSRPFSRIVIICRLMQDEMAIESPNFAIVRHLLSALFTMIEAERAKLVTEGLLYLNAHQTTFKAFLLILETHFKSPHGVDFYAEKLSMSSRNLNLICHEILHQSVSEIIETRKLIEAKNLLISSPMTIAEIGYDLGYNEKSYFTSVFKKKSGKTPTEFRAAMSRIIS